MTLPSAEIGRGGSGARVDAGALGDADHAGVVRERLLAVELVVGHAVHDRHEALQPLRALLFRPGMG